MEEEVILNKIIEEAQSQANEIISEAEEKANKIKEETLSKLAKESQQEFDIMKQEVKINALSEIEKVEFEARALELTEKKNIIDIIKEKVKQKIRDLEDDTYINLIDEKIRKYQDEESVELILPKKCYEQIKKVALGYGMKVLDVSDEFESGVIVKCGNIEYNYDFEENMEFMNDDIEKEIDMILFN